MSKVLVIQQSYSEKDLSSAARYGTIEFIFPDYRFQPSQRPGMAVTPIEKAIMDFNPDEDYLLSLGGDWVGVMMVGMAMNRHHPGREIRILRWERERDTTGERIPGSGFYVPSTIRF